jgi:hypothetical protein
MPKIKKSVEVIKNNFLEEEVNVVIQYYQQACNHARAYMDLRFKHFGTFVVIVTLLTGGVLKFPNEWEKAFCSIIGLLVSFLFWTLDLRTGQYLAKHWNDVYKLENYFRSEITKLCAVVPTSERPKRIKIFRASMITNYLFALFTLMWISSLLFHLDRYYQWNIFKLAIPTITQTVAD